MNEWVASCGLGTEARCLDVAGAELFFGGMEYGTFTFLQGGPCAGVINAIGGLDESDGDFCANDELTMQRVVRFMGALVVAW